MISAASSKLSFAHTDTDTDTDDETETETAGPEAGTDAQTLASFEAFPLLPAIKRAIADSGYTRPTPIQARSIAYLCAGKDLLGCAQTGTGKTAAFALPILNRLATMPPRTTPAPVTAGKGGARSRGPRALVLAPTRELALQIKESFETYGKHLPQLRVAVVFGGVGQESQVQAFRRGVEIVVATPGRLIDLMQQGHAALGAVETVVLDEADRMLDMGFIQPIRRILAALPRERQSVMFSATMARETEALAATLLRSPERVAVTPVASTVETITQWVLFVSRNDKRALLEETLRDSKMTRVLVFTRTKHGANRLAQQLDRGGVRTEAIHGNKSQSARQRALDAFKAGRVRVLVATDIAARGIDVDDVTHVVNFELPHEPESYVHRIGRTARAGAAGVALSFCDTDRDSEERTNLRDIERLIRVKLKVVERHPFSGARTGVAVTAAPAVASTSSFAPASASAPAVAVSAGPREGASEDGRGAPPSWRRSGSRRRR